MPGICGVTGPAARGDGGLLKRMLAPLQRHDWYTTETWDGSNAELALGRVALGFVNTAPQPAVVDQPRRVAVMDGEIHDCAGLIEQFQLPLDDATQQPAVLLSGLQVAGEAFLRALEGSFVAAIWDEDARQLHLINDAFGSRPLYLADVPAGVVFSSSLKSLLEHPDLTPTPSAMGLAQFFTYGHYLGLETSVDGVHVLPAGHWLTWDAGSGQWNRRASHPVLGAAEPGDWLSRIDRRMKEAVDIRCQDTQHLGLALSGGLDARTILALVDHDHVQLQTLCLGMEGSLDHRSSSQLAELVGCQHHNHILGQGFLEGFEGHLREMVRLTDGQYLSQCIVLPTFPLYRELGIEVLLRGHAGELMHMRKAYNYSLDDAALSIDSAASLEAWVSQHLQAYMLDGVDQPLFVGELGESMGELASQALRRDLQQVEHVQPPLQRIWHLFVHQRLRRETVLSMMKFRSVVEPRLPLLDRQLIDLLLTAPVELKLGETIQQYILERRRPDFLKVLNANTGAPVGAGELRQKLATLKMKVLGKLGVKGYQPYERLGLWLRRELAPVVEQILLSDECLDGGIFTADGVRAVVRRHSEQKANHTFLLMAMMIYQLGRGHLENSCLETVAS